MRVISLSLVRLVLVAPEWTVASSASHRHEGSVSMSPDSSWMIIAEVSWKIAMVQYSSLCEGAAVVSLDVVDIGDEVLGRVHVECGREEVNDGEKQEKDRTRTQPTDNQTHIVDGLKME